MPIHIITHPSCMQHEMGLHHPESPARLQSILTAIKQSELKDRVQYYAAPQVTKEQLLRVHDKDYIESILASAPTAGYVQIDEDTFMNPYTLIAAKHAAGAMIQAVDDVFQNRTKKVFCAVRPPGHHAEPDQAMGFCFFNNVAVGAAHALTKYDCKKIAIVDFDVHHGNGTEAMFIDNPKVYFWSSFQHPFYPGAELNNKPSHIHLSPLEAGSTSAAFRDNVQSQLVPTLMQFKPECIFISAGFDAHIQDPLANLQLKTDDYFFVTKAICEVAEQFSQGRVISTLEGGYHLNALAESAVAHIKAML